MRQRPLMIIEPNPIAQIDTPAAQRAAFEMFGLNQWRSADLSADHGARRARFFDWHDGGHGHHLKNSGPDFTPDLIHIRRRFTSDLTAVLRMGYLVSTSENNCVHAVTYRHSGERLFEDSIQLGSNVNNFWAIRGASDSRSAFRICAQIQGVIYVRSISRLILRTRSRFGRHAH